MFLINNMKQTLFLLALLFNQTLSIVCMNEPWSGVNPPVTFTPPSTDAERINLTSNVRRRNWVWVDDEVNWSCGPHTYYASEDECVKDPNYYIDLTSCSPVVMIGETMVSTGAYEPCYNNDHENGSTTDFYCTYS